MVSIEEYGLETAGETFGRAKCFWSVWERRSWGGHQKKVRIPAVDLAYTPQARVAIHIDEDGTAPEVPLSEEGGPYMIIRLQPMPGGLCRFSYKTIADADEGRTVIDISEAMERIVNTSEIACLSPI